MIFLIKWHILCSNANSANRVTKVLAGSGLADCNGIQLDMNGKIGIGREARKHKERVGGFCHDGSLCDRHDLPSPVKYLGLTPL